MRAVDAGELRGQFGLGGRAARGRVERGSVERVDAVDSRGLGLARGRAYAAFADAIQERLRTDGLASVSAANGVRPSVESVALALRDALTAGDRNDAVANLLARVDEALTAASDSLGLPEAAARALTAEFREALADRVGALARELGSTSVASPPATPTASGAGSLPGASVPEAMSSPAPVPSTQGALPNSTAAPDSTAPTTAVAKASYRVVQRTGIELVTQEGDVVRISLRTKEGFKASAGYSPTVAYLQVAAYSKTRFSVEVQGSFSASELAAIDDVLGQVHELAKDFYAGDAASAFAGGAVLDVDPTQLAAVSLRMSQSTSLRISGRAEWSGASLPSVPAVPLPSVATAAPGTGAGTPAPSTDGPVPTDSASVGEEASAGAAREAAGVPTLPAPTDAIATTGAPLASASADAAARASSLRAMADYLVKLFDSLGTTTVAGRIEFSARAKLQLLVTAVDGAKLPGSTTEAAASRLLGETVGATTNRATA
jgi:hypothetical protein